MRNFAEAMVKLQEGNAPVLKPGLADHRQSS